MKQTQWMAITVWAVLAFALMAASPVSSEAAGRLGRRILRPSQTPPPQADQQPTAPRRPFWAPLPAELRHDPAAYYQSVHPRYQTGFHARDMQNLGVPTGDVGLRGNGMFWTPW